jgi:hypothetical protein
MYAALGTELESIGGEILELPSGLPLQLAQGSDTPEVEVVTEVDGTHSNCRA